VTAKSILIETFVAPQATTVPSETDILSAQKPGTPGQRRQRNKMSRSENRNTTHGGSRPDLAATIMTEDAKTEENTAGSPCGAYIG